MTGEREIQLQLRSSIHPEHFGLAPKSKPLRTQWKGSAPAWDGYVGSHKTMGRPAPFQSFLERDLQTHLNADPEVVEYAAQPHQLIYWAEAENGQPMKRSYTPDIVARTRAGDIVVIDAKAKVFAQSDRWKRLEPYIRQAYETDHGARFIVLTEDEIRAQPRLSNCQIMLRHRPPGEDAEGEFVVRELVNSSLAETSIAAITAAAAARGVDGDRAFSGLMRMALAGEIKLDHSRPLSNSASIRPESRR